FSHSSFDHLDLHSFPTRRSSDLFLISTTSHRSSISGWFTRAEDASQVAYSEVSGCTRTQMPEHRHRNPGRTALACSISSPSRKRSEEHTSELQSRSDLVCRLLLE